MAAQSRVFFVNDDEDYLASMREALGRYGYVVRATKDEDEARRTLRNDGFDACIFDLDLGPGSRHGGIALIEMVRREERNKADDANAAVLLVSACDEEARLDEARRAGADECLTKPVTARQLAAALAVLGVPGTPDADNGNP
jgi:DNA-binding response OmpR family regulator